MPDYNRKVFTDLLIEDKEIVPFTNDELLIDHQFFYSHESDVEEALEERFNYEWEKKKYALAVRLQESLLEEENLDKIPDGCDANSFFKHLFKLEMRHVRSAANAEIAHCWVKLLKHRPEFVDRCPWHFFQGDRIWQTLQDEELLNAIKRTPLQVPAAHHLSHFSPPDRHRRVDSSALSGRV